MGWPATFAPGGGRNALLIGLAPAGTIQDLGPFLTGRLLETDLLPGTAVVCRADALWRPVETDGRVPFAFEGNAIGAVNLTRFSDRALCAAGRLTHRAPSIAYGSAAPDQVRPLARYDLDRHVILEVLAPDELTAWSGEPWERTCPPRLSAPCADPALIGHLFPLVRATLLSDPDGALLWPLVNGQVLLRERPGEPVTLHDPEDPAFVRKLRGLDPDARVIRALYGRSGWPDEPVPDFFDGPQP
jgi:hypothetical protein